MERFSRHNRPERLRSLFSRALFPILGLSSFLWFLIRVLPKPSRAGYPCMRVAAPLASTFVLYLAGLLTSAAVFRKAGKSFVKARYVTTGICVTTGLLACLFVMFQVYRPAGAYSPAIPQPPNDPIGEALGIHPGRVVWVWNPDATNEDCTLQHNGDGHADENDDGWFLDKNNDQWVIDHMVSKALQELTGEQTDAGAWEALFSYFNLRKHGLDQGYTEGEKIFIKINATSTWTGNITGNYDQVENQYYSVAETSPHVVLSVLRQLVNVYGVLEDDISVGDPMRLLYNHCYDKWHDEFPDIHYVAHEEGSGREGVIPGTEPSVFYSDSGSVLSVLSDTIYTVMEDADYMINIPALKAHARAGITLFPKNHFGSHTRSSASHLHGGLVAPNGGVPTRPDMGIYRVQMDMMGHDLIGQNTVLFLIDGLWAGSEAIDPPTKWTLPPFENDWTSSIFASQDAVAIESVGLDFLKAEYNGEDGKVNYPNMEGVDDYLHQAADSTLWPEDIVYDPENDGTPVPCLGVHEHWNNELDKEYTRNLGTGDGIELVFIEDADVVAPHIAIAAPRSFDNVALENTPITVEANVFDAISGVLPDSVFLIYSIEDESLETRIPMTNTAGDIFTADIEPLTYDTDVYFRVVACDNQLNRGMSELVTFEVTDARTLTYDDGIPFPADAVPEAESGFLNVFDIPADSTCLIHKVLFHFDHQNGFFDVVLGRGMGPLREELAGYDSVTNGAVSGTFFQFEIPDSISVTGPERLWVGMRYLSADTLLDPRLGFDETKEYSEVSYHFSGSEWSELSGGEAMIRVKVKMFERPTGIDKEEAESVLPKTYALSQNYPNPFNPRTLIRYDVPDRAEGGVPVEIDIYTVHGRLVKNLVSGQKQPGSYTVSWDGKNQQGSPVSSGVYLYRIHAGNFITTRKMLLIK